MFGVDVRSDMRVITVDRDSMIGNRMTCRVETSASLGSHNQFSILDGSSLVAALMAATA